MYRSGSAARFSDEFFLSQKQHSSTAANGEAAPPQLVQVQHHQLPTYNPESHVAKKEKDRFRSAEAAVHAIPLLLILCAVILWFFSSPVDMANKNGDIALRAGIR